MFSISPAQMKVFNQSALRSFEDKMLLHLRSFSPLLAKSAGEDRLRKTVQIGIHQAQGYGFTLRSSLQLYLELMLVFGTHFDSDPKYQWLRPYIVGFDGINERERKRLLYWHSTLYMDNVYGATGSHAIEVGGRVCWLNKQYLEALGRDFFSLGLNFLSQLQPQQWVYLNETVARVLLEQAVADSNRFGLADPAGAPLLLCLQFLFGHRVIDDPMFPWVSATLVANDLTGSDKVTQLLQRTQGFITAMLNQFKEARG